ncbi:UNKNOWN [Stylonychia lemnae]|uniref:Uncharacterized protein n=1 Tax=Stylonychia lemnae TaxID=5949 RepID=A0A078B789_STYLE|nr:UNKNOWN [Stylonychia lemnae]|eukprot:CDW89418.1 UNKNOWN [Stylonychia lemnae]
MCIVFFRVRPTKGIKLIVIFNRDEQPSRKRSELGVHFDPQRIACAVDLEANGTWLGFNLDTANFGFLTNYENKKFKMIADSKYRKGNLLMNFLKSESPFTKPEYYQEYLETFLQEGEEFNGTNIWLGNSSTDDVILTFAHNQENKEKSFQVINTDETIAFGNGRVNEQFFKQTLGQSLVDKVISQVQLEHEDQSSDELIQNLKNRLFKIAELNKIPTDRKDWVQIDLYNDSEAYWNSSIFLEKHEERLIDDELGVFATISSTVMIITDSNEIHLFERVYDHDSISESKEYTDYDNQIHKELIELDTFGFVEQDSFTRTPFNEQYIYSKF